MSRGQLERLVRRVRRWAGLRPEGDSPDGLLLERFTGGRDEAAFAMLVERHGTMVFGVARRVLGNWHDAEDVSQATFLVLARRAASLNRTESVGPWLHTVAFRLALRLRAEAARRPISDEPALETAPSRENAEALAAWHDLRPVLDEELQRLPEKYRAPVVLCCLEGKTHAEAARDLSWPVGTVAGRLARARELLRERLTRRGVTPSLAVVSGLLAERATAATAATTTARAALAYVAGNTAGIGSAVLTLAEGALPMFFVTKLKLLAGLILTAGLLAGAAVWGHAAWTREDAAPATPGAAPEQRAERTDLHGDPLPPGALARLGTTRWRSSSGGMRYLVFSPDGRLAATSQENREIPLWDAATGRLLRQFNSPRLQNRPIAFSADGKRLITAGTGGGKMHVWDVGTGKLLEEPPMPDDTMRVNCVSSDGTLLAAVTGRQEAWRPHVIDLRTYKELTAPVIDEKNLWEFSFQAFSPGNQLLVGSVAHWLDEQKHRMQSRLVIWDVATGKVVRTVGEPVGGSGIAATFSADGSLLASGTRTGTVHLWNVADWSHVLQFQGRAGNVEQVQFTRDGRHLVVNVFGYENNSKARWPVQVWDVGTGKLVREIGPGDWRFYLTPNDKLLAMADFYRSALRFHDLTTGERVETGAGHAEPIHALRFSPDQRALMSVDREEVIHHWDIESGRLVRPDLESPSLLYRRKLRGSEAALRAVETALIQASTEPPGKDAPKAKFLPDPERVRMDFAQDLPLAFSAGERHMALGLGTVRGGIATKPKRTLGLGAWDLQSGKELWRIRDLPFRPGHAAYSPDGKTLALSESYGKDTIRLLSAATGEPLYDFSGGRGVSSSLGEIAFSPDGRLLAAPCDSGERPQYRDIIRLWEVGSGTVRGELAGHASSVFAVAFTPDGRLLASAGYDTTVRLWDVATCRELACLRGHTGAVRCLAFDSAGKRLVSGSADTTLLVWDVAGVLDQARPAKVRLTPEALLAAWKGLAAADGTEVRQAMQVLTNAGDEGVKLLQQRIRPVVPPDVGRLPSLVQELDDPRQEVRERATMQLRQAEQLAEPLLRKALEGKPPLEVRRRVEEILQAVRGPVTDADTLRALRALEVLERLGTPDTRNALKVLAGGAPHARLTREARSTLDRMKD